jgi:hypothetical protein
MTTGGLEVNGMGGGVAGCGDVAGGAGSGGGTPAVAGLVARDVQELVIESAARAPVAPDGAAAGEGGRGSFTRGAFGCALVPPLVVDGDHAIAEPGGDRRGGPVDDEADGSLADAGRGGEAGGAVAHDVQGAEPQPGAARVDALSRAAGRPDCERGGDRGLSGAAPAGEEIVDGRGAEPGRAGDGTERAAVIAQLPDMVPRSRASRRRPAVAGMAEVAGHQVAASGECCGSA